MAKVVPVAGQGLRLRCCSERVSGVVEFQREHKRQT
jgi:hypothetical protein